MPNTSPIATRIASKMQSAQAKFSQSLSRLSYGTRLAKGGGNGADISLSSRLRNQFQHESRKTTDLQRLMSIYQTADQSLSLVQEMMQRMQEIATATADGSKSAAARRDLQVEFDAIREEIYSQLEHASFDGTSVVSPQTVIHLDATKNRLVFGDSTSTSTVELPIDLSSTATSPDGVSLAFTGDGSSAVVAGDLPPDAFADSYNVAEDGTLTVLAASGVLANDTDAEADPLTAQLVKDVTHGSLTLNADGSFSYTPDANFNGTDSFTYRADEATVSSDIATVTLTVTAVNDTPVTADDPDYFADEETELFVSAENGLLLNDSDVDGDTLSVSLVARPSNGTLSLNTDGSFEYTPDAAFTGTDTFTYLVNDGTIDSNISTVSIEVANIGLPPGSEIEVDLTDENGDPAGNGDQSFSFDGTNYLEGPASNSLFADDGSFSFGTWFKTDQLFSTSPPNVGVQILTVFSNDEGDALEPKLAIGFFGNSADKLEVVYQKSNGQGFFRQASNTNYNDGNWHHYAVTYDAAADEIKVYQNGAEIISVNNIELDVTGDQPIAIGMQNTSTGDNPFVGELDDISFFDSALTPGEIAQWMGEVPPHAEEDSYAATEDTPLVVAAGAGVLANDSDPAGAALTANLVSQASNGTVSLNADGSFTYTPDADFFGTDSFVYRADNGTLSSLAETVTITVANTNDLPTAGNDGIYAATQDSILSVNIVNGVLSNDLDIDGDTLSAVLDTTTSNGTLSLNANGSFQYTPDPGYTGADSFTYHVNDGTGVSATRTATIEVTASSGSSGAAGSVGDYLITPDGEHILYVAQANTGNLTAGETLVRMNLVSGTVESVDLLGEGESASSTGIQGKVRLTMDNDQRVWAASRYSGSSGHFVPVLVSPDLNLDYGWTDDSVFSAGSAVSPAIKIHDDYTDFAVHNNEIIYVDHDTKTVVRHPLSSSGTVETLLDVDDFLTTTLGNLGYTTDATHEFHGFSSDGTYMSFEAIRDSQRSLIVLNVESREWLDIPSGSTSDDAIVSVSFDRSNNIYWNDATTNSIKKAQILPGNAPTLGQISVIRQGPTALSIGAGDVELNEHGSGLVVDSFSPVDIGLDDSFINRNAIAVHAADLSLAKLSVTSQEDSIEAIERLRIGIDRISKKRAAIGSFVSGLSHNIDAREGRDNLLGQSVDALRQVNIFREQALLTQGNLQQASISELLRQIYRFKGDISNLLLG